MAVGLFTPIAASLSGLLHVALFLVRAADPLAAALGVLNALALLLLGPGGYSLDARFFGRRVLILRSTDKDPKR